MSHRRGSVRKAGNRLRINAQLIKARDGYHLWSERYDRTMDDVFAAQEEIARAIVGRLKVELVADSDAPLVLVPTSNVKAYNLVLEGHHHANRFHLPRALELYERALVIEPGLALAHARIAWVQMVESLIGTIAPRDGMPIAGASAERALSLDPNCGEAVQAMAYVRFYFDWDWDAAAREHRRAVQLSPGASQVHTDYGEFLYSRGHADEAVAALRRGADLDPLSVECLRKLGLALAFAGRFDEAIEWSRKAVELDPHRYVSAMNLAIVLLGSGDPGEAAAVLEGCRHEALLNPLSESCLGTSYARLGRQDEARAVAEALSERRGQSYVSGHCIGCIYLALEEDDAAMTWLERAYQDRDGIWAYLHFWRRLGLYGNAEEREPRFRELLQKVEDGGKA